MKFKFIYFIILILFVKCITQDQTIEEENTILSSVLKNNNFNITYKHKPMLTEYKTNNNEIVMNIANIITGSSKSKRAFRRFEAIADNLPNGQEMLKNDLRLQNTLRVMLMNPILKPEAKVGAAKLTTRLNDVPITLQKTEPIITQKAKDYSADIVVPRIKRIYRPDYYIENYKAGNWDV